jgi:hypothetical protein
MRMAYHKEKLEERVFTLRGMLGWVERRKCFWWTFATTTGSHRPNRRSIMKLNLEQLTFFYNETLGELGWSDEETESGKDPLEFVREEIRRKDNAIVAYKGLIRKYRDELDEFYLHRDRRCFWSIETDSEDNVWETKCGNSFLLEDETPKENGMNFCPFCGNIIEECLQE